MNLDTPLRLRRGPALPNRLALAPLTNTQSNPDGTLSELELTWLLARAQGGFGLTMTAAAAVNRAGQAWQGQLGVYADEHLPGLERLADGIRAAGSVSAVQLHHGGLRADPAVNGQPLVAPWDDPETGARALTTGQVQQAIADFAAAAARCERAGIDGVELHGAHGYLLGQFLDAEHNHRTDGYGGDATGRARALHEAIDAVRATTGPQFQVGVRLSPERFGVRLDDMVPLAAALLARGDLDYLELSLWDIAKYPMGETDGPLLIEHFTSLDRHGTALGVAGRIRDAATAQEGLDRGADFVSIGRRAIADRTFAREALADPTWSPQPFPLTRAQLREQLLGEPFVEYFASGWPQLVAEES